MMAAQHTPSGDAVAAREEDTRSGAAFDLLRFRVGYSDMPSLQWSDRWPEWAKESREFDFDRSAGVHDPMLRTVQRIARDILAAEAPTPTTTRPDELEDAERDPDAAVMPNGEA